MYSSRVGPTDYLYDDTGNMTHKAEYAGTQTLLWDEDNRLKLVNQDQNNVSYFLYDAGGERYLKTNSQYSEITINGQGWQGFLTNSQTLYVNPFIVVNNRAYTKHYFADNQRIVSKIGGGFIAENCPLDTSSYIYGSNIHNKADYAAKKTNVEEMINRDLIYFSTSWTMKNNQHLLSDPQTNGTLGTSEPEVVWYFYHPDHLGSSSYITDKNGYANKHQEYLPFGETFVDEDLDTNSLPYKFTGKELDEETGFYYFGARYYDPKTSVFLGVDQKSDNNPSWSPFVYCADNPIILVDPDGKDWILATGNKVNWYGGKTGDRSHLISTFNSSSGNNRAIDKSGNIWNLQQAKYQNVKNGGPTPAGKYSINLKQDPKRIANHDQKSGELVPSPQGGIEQIPKSVPNPNKPGVSWIYPEWGNVRAKLTPDKETDLKGRDDSFYMHDSQKGYTHGCIEVEPKFFNKLIDYRNAGNGKIDVIIQYPNPNQKTTGGKDGIE